MKVDEKKQFIILGYDTGTQFFKESARKMVQALEEKGFNVGSQIESDSPIALNPFDVELIEDTPKVTPNRGPRDRWNKLKS